MATETDRMALADEIREESAELRAAFDAAEAEPAMPLADDPVDAVMALAAASRHAPSTDCGNGFVLRHIVRTINSFRAEKAKEIAALRSEAGAAMREPQATGWLVSAGWKEGETRGPVIEFVVDTEAPSTGTYGDVWNHARYELHRCADQSGRSLPLQPEGGEAHGR